MTMKRFFADRSISRAPPLPHLVFQRHAALNYVRHFNGLRSAVGREAPTIKMHVISVFVGVGDDFHRVEYAENLTFVFQNLLAALKRISFGVVVICLLLDLFTLAIFVVKSSFFFGGVSICSSSSERIEHQYKVYLAIINRLLRWLECMREDADISPSSWRTPCGLSCGRGARA